MNFGNVDSVKKTEFSSRVVVSPRPAAFIIFSRCSSWYSWKWDKIGNWSAQMCDSATMPGILKLEGTLLTWYSACHYINVARNGGRHIECPPLGWYVSRGATFIISYRKSIIINYMPLKSIKMSVFC
jgi:hypothetical protein